jgi:hypothetical protein
VVLLRKNNPQSRNLKTAVEHGVEIVEKLEKKGIF